MNDLFLAVVHQLMMLYVTYYVLCICVYTGCVRKKETKIKMLIARELLFKILSRFQGISILISVSFL